MKRLVLLALTASFMSSTVSAQETKLLWGDTHLHTSYSPDAYFFQNTTATPDVAYRWAKGLAKFGGNRNSQAALDCLRC